ncbi:MAG: glucose 1-dehydrogenase [Prevotellaceae bacterium]|nr:glucose 1-dehydrogenase [Prevotellaceae bacterium]
MAKTVIITGGATGIGFETAKQMIQKGINVVITGRREELGNERAKILNGLAAEGAKAKYIKNDVTDEQAMKAIVESIVVEFGSLDYAVNNAGVSLETCLIPQSNSELFKQMIDTNILGVYYGMKYQLAQMQKQGNGSIVNLCSIAGLNGIAYTSTYAATKHAVVGMTKSSALDYAPMGIRINGVAPGATKTDIIAKQLEGNDPNYNEASISAMHPMNRLGRPEEIANGIVWLLSDEASFVTGHILNIDGGFQAK